MFIGLLILVFGMILLLEQIVPGFSIDFEILWPTFFIVIGIYNMIRDKKPNILSSIFIIIGTIFLLINLDILTEDFYDLIYPIILIIVGLGIMGAAITGNKGTKISTKTVNNKSYRVRNYNGIFGGVEQVLAESDFEGANIYSVFGSVDLDLTKVKIKDNIIIYAYSVFGGTTIRFPEEYNVVVTDTSVFGGTDNKIIRKYDDEKKTIYVNITNVFGGTDLR